MDDRLQDAIKTLRQIARGREDCGRPYSGSAAQDMARTSLLEMGEDFGLRALKGATNAK